MILLSITGSNGSGAKDRRIDETIGGGNGEAGGGG